MKGPSLQKTAALSSALHVTVFLISVLLLKQPNHIALPSPYTVNLVGHDIGPRESEKRREPSDQDSVAPVEKSIPKNKKISKIDEKRIDEMIDAIKAKKKIETIGKLRKEISIGRSERSGAKTLKQNNSIKSSASSKEISGSSSYEARIKDEIERQWFWPDVRKKDLEAIIIIKIKKDGMILLQDIEWEKKSDSRLFNNSALQAIAKASPVAPPPGGEMTIGLKFNPGEKSTK
jgi:outer membrane biosynthesis protein TonB